MSREAVPAQAGPPAADPSVMVGRPDALAGYTTGWQVERGVIPKDCLPQADTSGRRS